MELVWMRGRARDVSGWFSRLDMGSGARKKDCIVTYEFDVHLDRGLHSDS